MATSNLHYLEESRPPENLNTSTPPPEVPNKSTGLSTASRELPLSAHHLNTSMTSSDVNSNPTPRQTDINSNRVDNAEQCNILTIPQVTKSNSCRETRRPFSAPERKRNSYHCDVEEALSSLLWQPYEYQTNRSDSSDTLSSTLSSTSSASSSEYLATWLTQYGNAADPNLSLQMVTNLMALNQARVGERPGQWRGDTRPRDRHSYAKVGSTLSRLSSNRTPAARSSDSERNCDQVHKCGDYEVLSVIGDMRLEIGGAVLGSEETKPPNGIENETTAASNNRCLFVSTDMIPSNMTSVVSANVVGLPVAHSRSSSNISNRNNEQISNHPRSASEVLVLGSNFRSSTNLQSSDRNVLQPSHPRQASGGSLRGASEPPQNNTEVLVLGTQYRSSTNVSHTRQASGNLRGTSEPPHPINITHVSDNRSVQALVPQNELNCDENCRIPPLPNVSNINVNCYRAVPINVVSTVPTINCLNSIENTGNNVSNVHIVQAMPTTIPSISLTTVKPTQNLEVRARTFTSTEAQTDDTNVNVNIPQSREQRRRERRERRHQRRLNQTNHQHIAGNQFSTDRLPDLLNSHLPPPYATLPPSSPVAAPVVTPVAMPPPGVLPYQVPLVPGPPPPIPVAAPTGFRFSFPSTAGFRR